jgi:hypothetical protein
MEVTLSRTYRCAPEGHTTYVFHRGTVVTGRVAEMAIRDGAAAMPRRPRTKKPAQPDEVKDAQTSDDV